MVKSLLIDEKLHTRLKHTVDVKQIIEPEKNVTMQQVTSEALENYVDVYEKIEKKHAPDFFKNKAVCQKCRKVLMLSEFHLNTPEKKKNGHHSYCKSCRNGK